MKSRPRKTGKKEPPPTPAPVKKEIRGIFWLLAAIILGGSLVSFSPGDPLAWAVAGAEEETRNLFGTVGMYLAGGMFLVLGFSAFWLIAASFAAALKSFRGHTFSTPIRKTFFGLLLLTATSSLLHLQFPDPLPYRDGALAAGGLLGIHAAEPLKLVFSRFGSHVLLGVVFVVSFMMVTGISLGAVFARFGLWFSGIYFTLFDLVAKRRERRKRVKKTAVAHQRIKSMPKVRIIDPPAEKTPSPEQELFPFMRVKGQFLMPSLDLLADPQEKQDVTIQRESLEMNARRLERKLNDFGVQGEVMEILPGPVITMYEFKPAAGIKISKVAGLADDLALTLRAESIRIVAPIPGKAAIGIEIPNPRRETVLLKDILMSPAYRETRGRLPMALGKDITGGPVVTDLARMPHLLVAGATGAGKSVSINTMIQSILFKASPETVRFLMVDPKRIELSEYQGIPHLLHPVVTKPKDATKVLKWAVREMERRYMLLGDVGVRNIDGYNRKIAKSPPAPPPEGEENGLVHEHMPYIIIIIDELADLMMVSSKEVEESIIRLAQMARASGIHLIVATQRPSVDVLTGIIKANFPARISFQVSSKVDSRTILDTMGAEHLLGEGDMLFMPPGVGKITRIHGAFVSEDDIKAVCDFLKGQKEPEYDKSVLSEVETDEPGGIDSDEIDDKIDEAIDVVIQTGQASISMIQRRLRVGYNRAARMIEYMEREGIVGPSDGVRARDVYGRKDSI